MPLNWNIVTDFGDSAVTVSTGLFVWGYLAWSRWQRAMLAWAIALIAAGAAIGLLKLTLQSCGRQLIAGHLNNPSGHTAMSTAVYVSLAVLIGSAVPASRRWLPIAAAAGLSIAIGISRIMLGLHSAPEVVAGFAVGAAAAGCFTWLLASGPVQEIRTVWLVAGIAALVAALYGTHLPAEQAVHWLVSLIRTAAPQCR